ncbi:MAG TPA: hypothetical protein VK453_11935 [Micromonosporaceae bacterium]|nr:hypothetical protein [Micromonosporaceae bacterium]
MARLYVRDTEPEFGVDRNADGEVELHLRVAGLSVRISVGNLHEDVSLLAESLADLAADVRADILDGWQDTPDEDDGSITVDRGRYHVSLDGTRVGEYPSRDVAEIELARAMAAGGVFPNAWFVTDHGNHVDINDEIRRWHDTGGDQMAPLTGVQYQPGDRVRYAHIDWPCIVVQDWGPAGVEVHTDGDPAVRAHITDRDELHPDTD